MPLGGHICLVYKLVLLIRVCMCVYYTHIHFMVKGRFFSSCTVSSMRDSTVDSKVVPEALRNGRYATQLFGI